ncbi:MAG: hypothetical protein CME40_00015 [Haliea sp.]|nr:hypothetical protein [Haliea sp.]|tara:strand:+ start:1598 stop:2359 length:762 start_codon:yes stop_codon:yes gene_type:complete
MIKQLALPALAGLVFTLGGALEAAAQARPNLMFCGSSSATGADLYSGIGTLNEVSGCTPDSDTQALLITRSGTIAGNGADWLAYLNNGGIIITEYNNPELVYNEIYGTSYTNEGGGNCQDNVMPSVILNPSDPFWVANPLTPVGPAEDSCGSDLQDVVSGEGGTVIALGARDPENTVSLAYRNQGSGVLFLAGADWQDGEAVYTDASRSLFGAMITARFTPVSVAPVPALPLGLLGLLGGILGLVGLRQLRRQ